MNNNSKWLDLYINLCQDGKMGIVQFNDRQSVIHFHCFLESQSSNIYKTSLCCGDDNGVEMNHGNFSSSFFYDDDPVWCVGALVIKYKRYEPTKQECEKYGLGLSEAMSGWFGECSSCHETYRWDEFPATVGKLKPVDNVVAFGPYFREYRKVYSNDHRNMNVGYIPPNVEQVCIINNPPRATMHKKDVAKYVCDKIKLKNSVDWRK